MASAVVSGSTPKRLGEYLHCSAEAVERALREQLDLQAIGKRIGELLVAKQYVTRHELIAGLYAQRLDRLRICPLFTDLEEKELARIARVCTEYSVPAGMTFIEQGDIAPDLYLLASGRLEVYRRGEDGEEIRLAFAMPGEPIGEVAYFSNGVRSANVRAFEDAELLRLPFTELKQLFDAIPRLANTFLTIVTKRLQRANLLYEESLYRARATERSLSQLNQFLDLSDAEALGIGIEGLIQRLVHTASALTGAERGSLFLIDPATGDLWSKVAEGAEVKDIRVPAGSGVAGWVARHRQMVNIPDAYEDPRFNQAVDLRTGYRTRTILCSPVMGLDNATTLGVVQVINKRRGVFNRQDEMLLKAFSHQAAVAVENFSLYRRMVASHERMAILLDVAISISQTLDLATLISKIVGRLTELLACERSSFFVLDHDAGELWSMEAHGSELKEIRFPASAGLAGHAATHAELVNVVDAYEDERFNPAFDRQSGFRTRSVLCVPVMSRDGRVTGVTQAINKRGAGAFDAEDVELLKAISSQLGVTVENAKLHADAVNMRNYLKSVQESISNGIVTVDADFRLVTANHAAAQILDLPAQADALKHADLRELCGPGAQPLFTLMQAVYEGRASVIQYDVELRGAAGERAANINVLPLTDADGDFQGLVVVLEDVTQAKRVKSTLTRYMAQDIVERMLADPSQQTLGGVRGTATVLFSDIRHFTSIAERLSAEQTMDMLNEYFGLMVEEVLKERGVLDKFIGDAMMAVFGVPYAQADDAVRAVRTALAMRKALARFNASWTARGHPPIQIGIGINTDDVISGNMGSQKRMDYTVIGDGVNVASRMEGLNKEYGTMILITETTRALIGDEFKLRCIDRVIVKGKSEPIEVYEVLGDREHAPSPFEGEFASGLDAYRSGDFQRALALFRQVADIDRAAQVFAARCETLLVQPPGPGWMGVWAATSK